MTRFEEHVRAALDMLPPELAAGLENVAVVVEEQNAEEPDLYGLFDEQPYMPAKISIYRRPLVEDFGDDPARLQEEIRITVLHELAHYRDRRGAAGRAGVRVTTALEVVGVVSAVVLRRRGRDVLPATALGIRGMGSAFSWM